MAEPSNRPEGWSNSEQARQDALRQGSMDKEEDRLSHPVATGVGALGGAAAGAAAGMVGGPVGSVAGAVAGAVLGGIGGNAVGEAIDPAAEDRYWRENYQGEPYYQADRSYDDYAPAYQLGLQGRTQYGGRFDDTEERLSQDWDSLRGRSALNWNDAREPSRAAWQRVDQQLQTRGMSGASGSTGDDLSGSYTASSDSRDASYLGSQSSSQSTGQGINSSNPPAGTSSLGDGTPGSLTSRYSNREDDDNMTVEGNIRPRSSSDDDMDRASSTGFTSQSASDEDVDNDDVIDVLNDLLECCRDGEYGFNLSAEHVQASSVKQRLTQHADECRRAGDELIQRIRQRGGEPDDGGSTSGALHRGWVSLKGSLAGYSDRAMLEECERGEDAALARYRRALKQDLPVDVRSLVERQYDGVQRNHDEVKRLRDSLQDRA